MAAWRWVQTHQRLFLEAYIPACLVFVVACYCHSNVIFIVLAAWKPKDLSSSAVRLRLCVSANEKTTQNCIVQASYCG